MSEQPTNPPKPPDLSMVSNRDIMAEAVRRGIADGDFHLTDVPDDVLMRELTARAESICVVATYLDNDGNRIPKIRFKGDFSVVNANLNSACRYINAQLDGQWQPKERWQ